MIRFTPDTLRDAVLRPLAMASPDGWVYIEILAPDFRFLFILILVLVWLFLGIRRKWRCSPTWVLLAFVSASFIPWLYTTGNGRYFVPMLLAAGPLCIALVYELPASRSFRGLLVLFVLGIQIFAVSQNKPWSALSSWGLASWGRGPFFQIDLDAEALEQSSSYVTISVISYSLIAPQFPASSRWINLSSQSGADAQMSPDALRIQSFFATSRSLKLLAPSLPGQITAGGKPTEEAAAAINAFLRPHRIALEAPSECRLLRSGGLAAVAGIAENIDPQRAEKIGFWICPLHFPASTPTAPEKAGTKLTELIFQKIEATCPRFFPPGQQGALPIQHGKMRHYQGTDMRVYVLDDGTVYYKYHRALNPMLIGNADGVMSGQIKVDCTRIRGRSGLPWERQI